MPIPSAIELVLGNGLNIAPTESDTLYSPHLADSKIISIITTVITTHCNIIITACSLPIKDKTITSMRKIEK